MRNNDQGKKFSQLSVASVIVRTVHVIINRIAKMLIGTYMKDSKPLRYLRSSEYWSSGKRLEEDSNEGANGGGWLVMVVARVKRLNIAFSLQELSLISKIADSEFEAALFGEETGFDGYIGKWRRFV